jgi:hypothetical protein
MKNVIEKPASAYIVDPSTGPNINPIPTEVSIKAIYFSCSSGNVTDTIAYEVVCIDHEDQPCKNLNKNDNKVNIIKLEEYGVNPNPIIEIPIEQRPPISILFSSECRHYPAN